MNEEVSWFDFLPGVKNLNEVLQHKLGRETPDQGMYFRWQMFGDSQFTLAHVFGATLVLLFAIVGGITYSRAVSKGGEEAIVPPPKFGLRNLMEMFTESVLSVAEGVMGKAVGVGDAVPDIAMGVGDAVPDIAVGVSDGVGEGDGVRVGVSPLLM